MTNLYELQLGLEATYNKNQQIPKITQLMKESGLVPEPDEDDDQLKFVDIYGHDVDPELFDHWATVIADKDEIDRVDDFLATVRKYYHSKPLDITDIHNTGGADGGAGVRGAYNMDERASIAEQ